MDRKTNRACVILSAVLAAFMFPVASYAAIVIPAGSNPQAVAVTPDGTRALVTNGSKPGTVTVLSIADGSVVARIGVGDYPGGIAISPDGTKAVIANGAGANNVSVIGLATYSVTKTINPGCVATTLYDIAFTPNGLSAVMGDLSSSCTQTGLDVINVGAGSISFIGLSPFNGPFGVAVTPDGTSVLATNGILGTTIKRISLAGGAATTISGTSSSFGVAVTPDGSTAIVASGEGDTVKRINLATNTVAATIPYGSNKSTHNVAITPDGRTAVVVGDFDTGVISLVTNTLVATHPSGGANVAVTPDGKRALITNPYAGTVTSIPLQSDADRVFNWAEATFSQYFQPRKPAPQELEGYYYRYYSDTNVYLAVKGDRVYIYGPAQFGSDIVDLGLLADWLPQAQAAGF